MRHFLAAARHIVHLGRNVFVPAFTAIELIRTRVPGRDVSVQKAARTSSSGVRTDNTPKVRFSATVGKEPEVEVALV
jgi:hypothetical protein